MDEGLLISEYKHQLPPINSQMLAVLTDRNTGLNILIQRAVPYHRLVEMTDGGGTFTRCLFTFNFKEDGYFLDLDMTIAEVMAFNGWESSQFIEVEEFGTGRIFYMIGWAFMTYVEEHETGGVPHLRVFFTHDISPGVRHMDIVTTWAQLQGRRNQYYVPE